jgi:hypothetical protein
MLAVAVQLPAVEVAPRRASEWQARATRRERTRRISCSSKPFLAWMNAARIRGRSFEPVTRRLNRQVTSYRTSGFPEPRHARASIARTWRRRGPGRRAADRRRPIAAVWRCMRRTRVMVRRGHASAAGDRTSGRQVLTGLKRLICRTGRKTPKNQEVDRRQRLQAAHSSRLLELRRAGWARRVSLQIATIEFTNPTIWQSAAIAARGLTTLSTAAPSSAAAAAGQANRNAKPC